MYSAPPKLSTSTLVFASTKVEEVMKNKLLGDAQKAFKGHPVMEDGEKEHMPDTLEDSESESDSFGERMKLIEHMGGLGQSSSKQGQESNPNQFQARDERGISQQEKGEYL